MEIINEKEERGLIRRSSIRYMIPLMLGMLFAQSAPMVDAICVSGKLGEDALSALITVMPLGYLISTVGTLGGLGAGVFIAKCSGSGEKAKASPVRIRAETVMVSQKFVSPAVHGLNIYSHRRAAMTMARITVQRTARAPEELRRR